MHIIRKKTLAIKVITRFFFCYAFDFKNTKYEQVWGLACVCVCLLFVFGSTANQTPDLVHAKRLLYSEITSPHPTNVLLKLMNSLLQIYINIYMCKYNIPINRAIHQKLNKFKIIVSLIVHFCSFSSTLVTNTILPIFDSISSIAPCRLSHIRLLVFFYSLCLVYLFSFSHCLVVLCHF